jgi:hypothetical protein
VAYWQDSTQDRNVNAYQQIDWVVVVMIARHNFHHGSRVGHVDSVGKPKRHIRRRDMEILAAF